MKIAPTIFPLKSIDRKELHKYYENFDINANKIVDQMSNSLTEVTSNKVFSTTYRIAENPKAYDDIFKRYDIGWQMNTGTHIQLYDVSEFADKHNINLRDNEVLSYTDISGNRRYVFKMKSGHEFEVLQRPPLENPMESEVFKNTVGKALITLKDNCEEVDHIIGSNKVNSHKRIVIEYDPTTKSLNKEKFIEFNKLWMKSMLRNTDEETGENLLDPDIISASLKKLETDLTEFLDEIL